MSAASRDMIRMLDAKKWRITVGMTRPKVEMLFHEWDVKNGAMHVWLKENNSDWYSIQ